MHTLHITWYNKCQVGESSVFYHCKKFYLSMHITLITAQICTNWPSLRLKIIHVIQSILFLYTLYDYSNNTEQQIKVHGVPVYK